MSTELGTDAGLLNPIVYDDLAPREVPVTLRIKGEPRRFVLTEPSEDAACRYRNACMAAARMADGKVVGVVGMADVEPLLVSLCLFELVPDPRDPGGVKRRAVPQAFVRELPPRVVKDLFTRCRALGELEERDDQPETSESLRVQIGKLQARLTELENSTPGAGNEPVEDPVKNGRTAGPGTSA
jgi:hypothetical protein